MYYRLKPDCILVEGAARGAIYDLQSGKVYSINKSAVEILKTSQVETLDTLLDVNGVDGKSYISFLDGLTRKNLGSLYITDPGEHQSLPRFDVPVQLDFVWLELTSCCNSRCLHCYAASGPTENTDCMSHARWLSLIGEAREAGASAIQFIGGEPLLYPKWQELVIKAQADGYEFIEIFTNATLVDDACVEFFKKYKVNIATTIYADNAEKHDQVTLHKGSFQKTMGAIRKILDAGIPLRIASIIMKANELEVENILKLCQELGVESRDPDVVRPTGRGEDKDLQPEAYSKPPIQPPFYTDPHTFMMAQQYNSCLAGKIAVTSNGDVIPCIFARDQVCGNVLAQSLHEILNGQSLKQCWCTTKDVVEKCQDCEYRYACNDCRPLAQGSDSERRWLSPGCGCSYNPYTGKWNGQ